MRRSTETIGFSIAVAAACVAIEAQPFQNLGFEDANTNSTTFIEARAVDGLTTVVYGIGPTEDLLPGWQLFEGTELAPRIGINSALVLAGSNINLFAPPDGGKYALDLGFSAENLPWSLVQQGDIPSDAEFLSFVSRSQGILIQPPHLTLGGQELSVVRGIPEPFGLERLLYDVTDFAGQNAELRLTYDVNTSYRTIDDIRFSVPEPSSWALILLGGVMMVFLRSCQRKSK